MSIVVKFNGVDQSQYVLWKTLNWKQNMTSQADLLTFKVQKFGSRSFSPTMLDEVTMEVDGDKVFGGNIVQITEDIASVERQIYSITVKDYTHLMDRRLIVEKYTSTPVINIITDILNRYVNKGDRLEIATFESNEVWSGGSIDTTNYRVGSRGRKLTSTNLVPDSMYRNIIVDLQPSGFTTSDYIEINVYVDTAANLSSAVMKIGDSTLTNYFSKNITSQIVSDGWNLVRVVKSDFTSTGSPTWPTTAKIYLEVTAKASVTVNVTFDNWNEIKTIAFNCDNAQNATQVVNYMAFNYEAPSKAIQRMAELFQWNWYVDENKSIHFFAKFDKGSTFNLTDTGQKYVYNSLSVDSSADQLRNSIFVRGGDYLAPQITENLTHQADGSNKFFKLGYKYSSYTFTKNSVVIPVGIDNIDSFVDNSGSSQSNIGGTAIILGDAAARTKQAQQVIVTKSGRRSKIKLRIRKVGTPADNFQVQVFTDSGSNTPSATNKSTVATLAGGSITTSFVEYVFSLSESSAGDLNFTQPTTYHIVLSRSGANDASNYFEIDAVPIGNYVGNPNTWNGSAWGIGSSNPYFIELLDFDVLYSYNEKLLTFSSAPAGTDVITWAAQPYLPIIIQYRDISSISSFGEYQFKVIDKSIKTKDGAKQRALEEILAYAQKISEATFKTYTSGLVVGQTINIQSTIRGLNLDLIINSVTAKARTPDILEYSVSCVSTKTMGIIYWLQDQILKDNQDIVIDENEDLDKTDSLSETFGFTASYSFTKYTGKVWSNDAGSTPNALQWDGGATHIWI